MASLSPWMMIFQRVIPIRFVGLSNEGQLVEGAYFILTEGSIYIGAFEGHHRCGLGVEFCADNSIYEGEWADDKRQGVGTIYSADGNSIVFGTFDKDGLVHEQHRWAWTASLSAGQEIEIPDLNLEWKTSCMKLLKQGPLSEPWKRREELRALRKALDRLKQEALELEAKVSL